MSQLFSWMRKWWPGLIPLAVVWIAAIWSSTAYIEADLAARATAELKDTVLDKTRISTSGRDVQLSAEAFSEEGHGHGHVRDMRDRRLLVGLRGGRGRGEGGVEVEREGLAGDARGGPRALVGHPADSMSRTRTLRFFFSCSVE